MVGVLDANFHCLAAAKKGVFPILKNNVNYLYRKAYVQQSDLAEYCQVSRETIRKIENGAEPRAGLALRLASALNCTVEDLFAKDRDELKFSDSGDWRSTVRQRVFHKR